jgi:hypothetical protein
MAARLTPTNRTFFISSRPVVVEFAGPDRRLNYPNRGAIAAAGTKNRHRKITTAIKVYNLSAIYWRWLGQQKAGAVAGFFRIQAG